MEQVRLTKIAFCCSPTTFTDRLNDRGCPIPVAQNDASWRGEEAGTVDRDVDVRAGGDHQHCYCEHHERPGRWREDQCGDDRKPAEPSRPGRMAQQPSPIES